VIFGDGSQVYDFIYVDDAAAANVLAMKADCADECFNVGTGIGTSINDIIHRVLALSGTNLTPEYRPQAQSFVTNRIGSTEKAERLLGFKAGTPLDEGLKRVVEWRMRQQAVA
jgi:UDP-glucose 4-epimerase